MIRLVNTSARLAHGHPHIVLTMLAGVVVTLAGLAGLGAVALISDPTAWKLCLFAAACLAAFVCINSSGRQS
jgi:hypothetical protein